MTGYAIAQIKKDKKPKQRKKDRVRLILLIIYYNTITQR